MINSRLYNVDINEYLKGQNLRYFKGVFSADNIPNFESNFVIICNLSNVLEVGSHFVVIARIQNDLYYLDSLAVNFINKKLKMYMDGLKNNSGCINYLTKPIQSIFSSGCGIYCIFFTLLLHASEPIDALLPFKELKFNDEICIGNIFLLT